MPVYLDANGNPVQSTYLDENGNPIGATPEQPKSVGGFLANIPSSAAKLAGDVGHAVLHPIDTVNAMKDVAVGGLEKGRKSIQDATTGDSLPAGILPDPTGRPFRTESIPAFDNFVSAMKQRYGGAKAIGDTLYNDPVGSAVDLSALLTGGSSLAERAGLGAVSKAMRAAGEVIDPMRQGARAVSAIAGKAGSAVAPILGKTTGVGSDVIKTGAEGSAGFAEGLRGNIDHADILNDVKEGVKDLADKRRADYQQRLAQLPAQVQVSAAPVQKSFLDGLKKFNIKVVASPTPAGLQYDLDFSRSTISDAAQQGKLKAAMQDLSSWGSKALDETPYGMDTLKQRLSNLVNENPGRADAILTPTKNATRSLLETQVPGYKEMTKGYADASDLLDQLNSELSVGRGAKQGTGIRKLAYALNQSNDYRRTLIDTLDQAVGGDIHGKIAGVAMNPGGARGIAGAVAGVGAALSSSHVPAILDHPFAAAAGVGGLLTTSPRAVGELLMAISKARKAGRAVQPALTAPVGAAARAAGAASQ
jgi:hypothetical protein